MSMASGVHVNPRRVAGGQALNARINMAGKQLIEEERMMYPRPDAIEPLVDFSATMDVRNNTRDIAERERDGRWADERGDPMTISDALPFVVFLLSLLFSFSHSTPARRSWPSSVACSRTGF